MVNINITGPAYYSVTADFGLVSSRMAECLGVIAAAKYLRHYGVSGELQISANNKEFVEYALREINPRQKEVQIAIKYMWQVLKPFFWNMSYEKQQKTKLRGGTTGRMFPRNLFPWLKIEQTTIEDKIFVKLPECPAVQAQFVASIKSAKRDGANITLPLVANSVLDAWELAVTRDQ